MVARQRAGIDRLWAVKQGCATITGGAMLLTEIVEEIADTRDVGRLTLFQYSNAFGAIRNGSAAPQRSTT